MQTIEEFVDKLQKLYEEVVGISHLQLEKMRLEGELAQKEKTIAKQLEEIRNYIEEIKKLQDEGKEVEEKLEEANKLVENCSAEVASLKQMVEELKKQMEEEGIIITEKPEWLNDKKKAYTPFIQIPKANEGYEMEDPTAIYTQSDFLDREIKAETIRQLPLYERLIALWKYVVENFDYVSDVGDNWSPHVVILVRKKDDCDGTTTVFVDGCRAIGIPADRVFNAVGPTGFGYHSYPIVYLKAEDFSGTNMEGSADGWYIFETTLTYLPSKPKALKGSVYWVDSTANWKYQGRPYSKDKAQFNGTAGKKMTGNKKDKEIDRGKKKKIDDLREYWEEQDEGN